jgi:hypothetical protein
VCKNKSSEKICRVVLTISLIYISSSSCREAALFNVRRVTMWPALENVTELCEMTRFLQTLDMCAFRANVTRLLAAENLNASKLYYISLQRRFLIFIY